jgi:hypothetical protein
MIWRVESRANSPRGESVGVGELWVGERVCETMRGCEVCRTVGEGARLPTHHHSPNESLLSPEGFSLLERAFLARLDMP